MKYNREQAVKNATEVFSQLGFQGSKMRDLQTRMDMRPGSIYAGFGSKEGLFKEVLDYYVETTLNKIDGFVAGAPDPLNGLRAFFNSELLTNDCSETAPMCLLVKTVTELEESQPELAEHAQQGMQNVARAFNKHLKAGQLQGVLKESADTTRLAKWLQMQMMGLRLYLKNRPEEHEVSEMIEDIFTRLH